MTETLTQRRAALLTRLRAKIAQTRRFTDLRTALRGARRPVDDHSTTQHLETP